MTNNVVARKSYTFTAEYSSDIFWKCPWYIYKGTFGRFEAWNPSMQNVQKQIGIFRVSPFIQDVGQYGYMLSDITVNGVSYYSNGQFLNGLSVSGFLNGLELTFTNTVASNSEVLVTIKSSRTYIPWIPYKDRAEFYYAPRRGMIDWDGLPCDSIGVSQSINMEFKEEMNWFGFTPINLVGLVSALAASNILPMEGSLSGRGILSVIKNNSSTGSALYSESGELLNSAPQEVIKYKYETAWYRQYLDPSGLTGTLANPSIVNQAQCLTGEYFLLKYHDLNINPILPRYNDSSYQFVNFLHYILFPYLIYGDFGIRGEQENRPYRFPKLSGETPIENIDLSYRSAFFDLSNNEPKVPSMVDRLISLSKLPPSTIRNNTEQAPTEYTNGIIDEFNYLNSRIKINKLIKMSNLKLTKTDLVFNTYKVENLSMPRDSDEQAVYNDVLDVLENDFGYNLNIYNDFLDRVELFVIMEDNCSKNFNSISEDKTYTVCGKLLDSRWMLASKAILKRSQGSIDSTADPTLEYSFSNNSDGAESILQTQNLWEFLGVSSKTQSAVYEYANSNLDKVPVFLIIRGFDDDNSAEIVLKDKNQDFIMEESLTEEYWDFYKKENEINAEWQIAPPENEDVVIPVITVKCEVDEDSTVKLEGFNYVKIILHDERASIDYEVSRKVLTPSNQDFTFNIFEDMLCPLMPSSDGVNFYFNPPEFGFLNSVTFNVNNTSKTIDVYPYEFEIDPINETSKPESNSYEFQVVYDNNSILPYRPSSDNINIPQSNDFGWAAIVENNSFKGVKMSRPWDGETKFFLRCIKKNKFEDKFNPIRKTKKIKLELSAPGGGFYPGLKFYLNRLSENDSIYSCECVGLHRLNASIGQEWYIELIPGKGLKVMTGHGVSFNPFVPTSVPGGVNPFQTYIAGSMDFPWAYLDVYGENQRTEEIEMVEQNGLIQLEQGSELEINSNLSDMGTLNLYTLTTYSSIIETDIRLITFYDKTFDDVYIFSNMNGFIEMKKTNSKFRDNTEVVIVPEKDEDGLYSYYDSNSLKSKVERTVFLGKGETSEEIIQSSLEDTRTRTTRTILNDGTIVDFTPPHARWEISLVKTLSDNHFIEGMVVDVKLPNSKEDSGIIENSAFATISYSSTQSQTTEEEYGYTYGLLQEDLYGNGILRNPRQFNLKNGWNFLHFPCIFEPQKIFINLTVPKFLTKEQFDVYLNNISDIKITAKYLFVVEEYKVPRPLAISATISKDGNINVFYNSESVYMPSGDQFTPSYFEDASITQYIQSTNGGSNWTFPGLEKNMTMMIENNRHDEIIHEERQLSNAGYMENQIELLLQKERRWDTAMIINAMRSPQMLLDHNDNTSYLFGMFKGGTTYNATCWKINNSTLKSSFLPCDIEPNAINNIIPRSSQNLLDLEHSNNALIAGNIPRQVLGIIKNKSGAILVIYTDINGDTKARVSTSSCYSWRDIPLSLFGSSSNFYECTNISIIYNDLQRQYLFFGLKKVGSYYHLYSLNIPEITLNNLIDLDAGDPRIQDVKRELDNIEKVLVVGNPNDLPLSDYEQDNSNTKIQTRIGNAVKNTSGDFVILKPYFYNNPENFEWDEENPSHFSYSLDESIKTLHTVHGYTDKRGLIRIFYINNVKGINTIACKVSENNGQTWKVDLLA